MLPRAWARSRLMLTTSILLYFFKHVPGTLEYEITLNCHSSPVNNDCCWGNWGWVPLSRILGTRAPTQTSSNKQVNAPCLRQLWSQPQVQAEHLRPPSNQISDLSLIRILDPPLPLQVYHYAKSQEAQRGSLGSSGPHSVSVTKPGCESAATVPNSVFPAKTVWVSEQALGKECEYSGHTVGAPMKSRVLVSTELMALGTGC